MPRANKTRRGMLFSTYAQPRITGAIVDETREGGESAHGRCCRYTSATG